MTIRHDSVVSVACKVMKRHGLQVNSHLHSLYPSSAVPDIHWHSDHGIVAFDFTFIHCPLIWSGSVKHLNQWTPAVEKKTLQYSTLRSQHPNLDIRFLVFSLFGIPCSQTAEQLVHMARFASRGFLQDLLNSIEVSLLKSQSQSFDAYSVMCLSSPS